MNNDSLDRLEMTMRRCDNNMKEIYRKKKDKDNGLEFAFLDRFMNYVNSMDENIKL